LDILWENPLVSWVGTQWRKTKATTMRRESICGISGRSKWVEPGYNAIMATRLTIDKAGRVVIPKSLREELRLEPGDSLEMETAGEAITLRPVRGNGQLRKEHGVWVFYGGHALPASATDEMLRQLREERDAANFGSDR
jgi:AbrB family looped-hinge helix DNA binding protein